MRVLYILYILEMFEPDLEKIRSSNFACVDMEYGRIRSIDKNTLCVRARADSMDTNQSADQGGLEI